MGSGPVSGVRAQGRSEPARLERAAAGPRCGGGWIPAWPPDLGIWALLLLEKNLFKARGLPLARCSLARQQGVRQA